MSTSPDSPQIPPPTAEEIAAQEARYARLGRPLGRRAGPRPAHSVPQPLSSVAAEALAAWEADPSAEPTEERTSTPSEGADPGSCRRPVPCNGVDLNQLVEGAPIRFCGCPDGQRSRERHEQGLSLGYREAVVPARLAGCTIATAAAAIANADTLSAQERQARLDALDAARRFVASYTRGLHVQPAAGLVLFGPVGTGKSGLLAAVTYGLRCLGVPVLWYTYAGLYAAVQDHYGTDHRDHRQAQAERAPVLVLDDLGDPYRSRGEDQETEDRRRIVHAVVSARAAHFRPTLVSANYGSLNELADQFDPRIADRLRESCERHTMPGQSLRRAPRI